jgi:hypothetical protein
VDKKLQSQQAAVMPLIKQIYNQLYGPRVAWGTAVNGGPTLCGIGDPLATRSSNLSIVQYTAELEAVPYAATGPGDFQLKLNAQQFAAQVTKRLEADGWPLRRLSTAPTVNPEHDYTARRDGLDIVVGLVQNAGSAPAAVINVSGPCFNAGSEAHGLIDNPDADTTTVALPHPGATAGYRVSGTSAISAESVIRSLRRARW